MANGHHAAALRLVDLEPEITTEPEELGTAMEAAVMELCAGMNDYQTAGTLSPAFRQAGGRALVRVVKMQLSHGGDTAFKAAARRAALRHLRSRYDRGLLENMTPVQADEGVLFWVDAVLDISSRVCADERVRAH
jgi:hypothetical protein